MVCSISHPLLEIPRKSSRNGQWAWVSTKPPWTSWMFNFWGFADSPQTPTNKKLEVWTQYRLLLSYLGGYMHLSSFQNFLRPREFCKKKSWNQEKSWEITRPDKGKKSHLKENNSRQGGNTRMNSEWPACARFFNDPEWPVLDLHKGWLSDVCLSSSSWFKVVQS